MTIHVIAMEQAIPAVKNRDESEYVDAVREHEPAATSEVAETVGVTRQGADYRLRRLKEQGLIRVKKVGNSLIWFLPEDES